MCVVPCAVIQTLPPAVKKDQMHTSLSSTNRSICRMCKSNALSFYPFLQSSISLPKTPAQINNLRVSNHLPLFLPGLSSSFTPPIPLHSSLHFSLLLTSFFSLFLLSSFTLLPSFPSSPLFLASLSGFCYHLAVK